uniref:DUF6824 domain-containing protein n=1 Tax=Cyclophora tenuis TaxID=216820 RepID=A0A7S1GM39_CYCTE|mmetsp:Transcript_3670/g.6273  ORF Transcript_3670/g.6273 Transcript_3670/m.6273 type:complete len:348 (+) Transcript_3670:113-1156(+)|eukprot:CAMPEP_0116551782 /NCGR_PEP_ID=MMETSP0397-20121206/6139_1 /TAXON_ID=216820 /ORGANISM="Cyclophora tenuis, Strain ECT3854" /LENGTH=347 /DNA_ID=CAMNT_0004076693 /DNA_START=105 /DNA_END=1148 /DNA_ORIENTATION=+
MDTLASIAVAAAQLDHVVDRTSPKHTSSNESRVLIPQETPLPSPQNAGPQTIPSLPPRQGFGNDGLRVVSTESMASFAMQSSKGTSTSRARTDEDDIVPSDPDSMEGLILLQTLDARSQDTPPPPSPQEVIGSVQEDDVLCGRGGETNHHPGNIRYRGLVKKYQLLYLKAKRRDKPKIARLIVDTIRRRHGRFLKKDAQSNTWRDVGNNKAREKTSQALREGAPELRNGQPPKNKNAKKRKRDAPTANTAISTLSTANLSTSSIERLSMAAAIVSPSNPQSRTMLSQSPTSVVLVPPVASAPPPAVPSDDETEDDESSCGDAQSKRAKQVRGPRLKLLKARLVDDSD